MKFFILFFTLVLSLLAIGQTTNADKQYLGNGNLLINPSFENGKKGWTCTTGTCTSTTTSGEFSEGAAALKITTAGGGGGLINVSQAPAIIAGSITQHVVGVNYKWLSTDIVDFQICTTINGTEKTCVPTANLIGDNSYHTIEIPEVATPGQSLGIKFKSTTNAVSKIVYVDKAYVKQGIGAQALHLDNVYSAQVSAAGVVSGENKDFISGNCTTASPHVCTFNSGIFTIAPNCSFTDGSSAGGYVTSIQSTSTTVSTYFNARGSGSASSGIAYSITCQKSGNDYLASSAAVYSQASANYGWTAYTPTVSAGFGTVTNNLAFHKRVGDTLFVSGSFTVGTRAATLLSVTLPNSLTINASSLTLANTTSASGNIVGYGSQNTASAMINALTATGTSTALVYFGSTAGNTSLITPTDGVTAGVGNSANFAYNFQVPISGWSNSSAIVGTFAGTPKIPGYDGNVDTFSVSYGTTAVQTVCSASPCSYLDQIGTEVTSVTRASTGTYTLNTSKTYAKLKCSVNAASPNYGLNIGPFSCANCSGLGFNTYSYTGAIADSYGTLMCQGSY